MTRPERGRVPGRHQVDWASHLERKRQEPVALLGHSGGEALEDDGQVPGLAAREGGHGRGLQLPLAESLEEGQRLGAPDVSQEQGLRHLGERMEAEGHGSDEAERPDRPDKHPREVEPGDVLHHLAPSLRRRPVGPDHRDADDEVPGAAVPGPERSEGVRGQHSPCRRPIGQGRVESQPLAVEGEGAAEGRQGDARFRDDDLIGGGVLEDPIEASGPEEGVERARRGAEAEVGPAAGEDDRAPFAGERTDDAGGLLDARRGDDLAWDDPCHGVERGAGADGRFAHEAPPAEAADGRPAASPHILGFGRTFPGLKRRSGSKAERTRSMVSRSAGANMSFM